jgi:tetratricopeptide (TPR) repeat protein
VGTAVGAEWAKSPNLFRVVNPRKLAVLFLCVLSLDVDGVAQQENGALGRARSLIQQKKNEEAIAELKALAARRPAVKGINHELGVAYYYEGEYPEAAKYLLEAWHENPEDRDAVQLLGLSYYFSGQPAQAIPALEKIRLWHPNANIDAIYILGLCYVLTKNYPEALATFASLYGVATNSAEAHLLLARMLLRQGFDPIAELEVRKALSFSPQVPLAHFTLGEFYVYKADYPKAVEEFEMELAFNSGYAPALTQLGEVYWRLNRFDDAEKVLQRSIWLDSTRSEPYVIMGKVQVRKGQLTLAERTLQRALAMNPNSYTAHYFLGQLYREMGKIEAAEREMKIAAQIQQLQGTKGPRDR